MYTTIDIVGGLGNHLFQIAFLHYFIEKSNIERKLIFKYDIKCDNAYQLPRKTFWDSLFKDQFKTITNICDIPFIKYCDNSSHIFNENLPYNIDANIKFNGFFQSFKYIDDNLRDKLTHIIYSNEDLMYDAYDEYNNIKKYFGNDVCDDEIVSVHVRRTDYIYSQTYHNNLSLDYYKKALSIANKKYVVVFSDDIHWCKTTIDKNLYNFEKIYFVDTGIVEIDFLVMSMIKHNIIANSTFSLWSSFISSYDGKQIIAPKEWYAAMGPKDWNEIYHKYITNII